MHIEKTFNEKLTQVINNGEFSIFWFTNHDNGETYKIFSSGKVEWSKENKKGLTVSNKTRSLYMLGYAQGYNDAKSDFEKTGTMRSIGLEQGDPPSSEMSASAISEAIGEK